MVLVYCGCELGVVLVVFVIELVFEVFVEGVCFDGCGYFGDMGGEMCGNDNGCIYGNFFVWLFGVFWECC